MKKILGISLVAVLAVSPLMANAAIPAGESGLESNAANVAIASAGTYYAGKTISDADRAATASAAYVKGAYNDAISAVNKVAADAASATSSGITSAVNALDATVTQTAGADGLALQVVEENGVITGVTGSIAANTYDAYGAATSAVEALDATESQTAGADGLALSITEVDGVITSISGSIAANTYDAHGAAAAVENKLDDGASGYDIDAKTLKVQGASVLTGADIATMATQDGVENTIETATYSTSLNSGSTVTGYVPVMVNWGDSTANNTSAVALASGTVASASFSTTATAATYAEPVVQAND